MRNKKLKDASIRYKKYLLKQERKEKLEKLKKQ